MVRERAGLQVARVALLLSGSGFCALIYQTVWLRQFRLIFGASTLASAAVVAIFMGGLGFGGIYFGRRVDRSRNPLAMYGYLEIGVALSAAATPLLLWMVRQLYLFAGGSFMLGPFLGTLVRLLLSVIVLVIPTVLMGGTLPAAARSAERIGDASRGALAVLYATNTVGAVMGTLFSTFYLLENFGNLKTLVAAALLNLLVGLMALSISARIRAGRSHELAGEAETAPESIEAPAVAPRRFVYVAAGIVGFAFFLMELVWYRMLTPLLGGTTYTFGLILAIGLAGVGAGSYAYAILRRGRATIGAFAVSCACEALALAIPIVLGDRLAFLALLLRPLGAIGFSGSLLAWTAVTAVVVFPPAFIAGVQFPLLISLLGEGREDVGRHVGYAYAWNTAGAILGSIAGGFGAMPLLTAPGTWRATAVLLVTLSGIALWIAAKQGRQGRYVAISATAGVSALVFITATGPSAFWRHTPIGAGRADIPNATRNRLIDLQHTRQRTTIWEAEGVESSVSLANMDGLAFIVNGKSDGHARQDGGTQVMGGVLPAILHPNPKRAVVIGLGTGTTAGWLAAVPSIERVDAVEIEPSIVEVARRCTAVNRDFLRNPKGHVRIGDGREFLLARGDRYDIISSEPSNPYRAGIANLFTVEFYEAAISRLNDRGIFVQFLQAYEVDAPTIRTIYGTITSVFPVVETWQSQAGDLLLVGSRTPIDHDPNAVRRKLMTEPIRSAVRNVWWVEDVGGLYARYVAGTESAQRLGVGARKNTDDRTVVEYAFARTLGINTAFGITELRAFSRSRGDDLPKQIRLSPDGESVERHRLSIGIPQEALFQTTEFLPAELRGIAAAQQRYVEGAYSDTWLVWQSQKDPVSALEVLTKAEALAERGDPAAEGPISQLRQRFPVEADALRARLQFRRGNLREAALTLASVFERYRTNPWPLPIVMRRSLVVANLMTQDQRFGEVGEILLRALDKPFAVEMFNEQRLSSLLLIADRLSVQGCSPAMLDVIRRFEPHVPWQALYLGRRSTCYQQWNDPRAEKAAQDLREFLREERVPLEQPLALPGR